jgi:hypothetical protein
MPQGVGSSEADGGPSLQGFAPPPPPRPSATAAADGRESSDLIATPNGTQTASVAAVRGPSILEDGISGGRSPLSSSLQWVSLVLSA